MASGGRGTSYSAKSDESLESLTKKLTADMRDNLRELALVAPLSDAWNDQVDKLHRVANISEMEKKIPKAKADATLWEGEELVLRYMLEDGKLNLCIRLLDEYLAFRDASDAGGRTLTPDELTKCLRFEFGVAQLVANALMHKEAMQTTELPLLGRVTVTALKRAVLFAPTGSVAADTAAASAVHTAPAGAPARGLECISLQFIAAMAKHATGSFERKVVGEIVRSGIMEAVLRHMHTNAPRIDAHDLMMGLEGLSTIVATEEFMAAKARAVSSPEGFAAGAGVRTEVMDPLCEDLAVRKKLRPLLDYCAELQRKVGK